MNETKKSLKKKKKYHENRVEAIDKKIKELEIEDS